jgi:hypothetical protein
VPPPGKTEVLLFWLAGIVITVLSGAVAISGNEEDAVNAVGGTTVARN